MHILILGTGSIGERHLRNFLKVDGVRCSFVEPDSDQREAMGNAYSVEQSFGAMDETDLSGYDGVVICTPTDQHVPIMTRLVKDGLPVLSEKPLAMNRDGVPELLKSIDQQSAIAAVAYCHRHQPVLEEAKTLIAQGAIGPVRFIQFHMGQYWPDHRAAWPPAYALSRGTGGGAIPDHLIHYINLFQWYFGQVEMVSAYQRHEMLPDIPTEDHGMITLKFKSGATAAMSICLFQRDDQLDCSIIGESGTICFSIKQDYLQLFQKDKSTWVNGQALAGERDDMFKRQAEHFIQYIRGEASPRCTVKEANDTLNVILAALESSDGNSEFVKCG